MKKLSFKSLGRKFSLMLAYMVISVLNDYLGWNLTPETMQNMLIAAVGYAGAEGLADAAGAVASSLKKPDSNEGAEPKKK